VAVLEKQQCDDTTAETGRETREIGLHDYTCWGVRRYRGARGRVQEPVLAVRCQSAGNVVHSTCGDVRDERVLRGRRVPAGDSRENQAAWSHDGTGIAAGRKNREHDRNRLRRIGRTWGVDPDLSVVIAGRETAWVDRDLDQRNGEGTGNCRAAGGRDGEPLRA